MLQFANIFLTLLLARTRSMLRNERRIRNLMIKYTRTDSLSEAVLCAKNTLVHSPTCTKSINIGVNLAKKKMLLDDLLYLPFFLPPFLSLFFFFFFFRSVFARMKIDLLQPITRITPTAKLPRQLYITN